MLDLWLPPGSAIRTAPGLSPEDTVLVILATAVARDSRYETKPELECGTARGADARAARRGRRSGGDCYTPEQADLIAFARAVTMAAKVDPPLWARVHDRLGDARTTAHRTFGRRVDLLADDKRRVAPDADIERGAAWRAGIGGDTVECLSPVRYSAIGVNMNMIGEQQRAEGGDITRPIARNAPPRRSR